MSRSTCKIKGLKYPSADKITSRISTLRRSMACTLMHRDACSPEQEEQWSKYFGDKMCAYCGRPATHLDHLHPMIRDNKPTGYGTDPNNLVPCCEKCNRSKGNMNWEDFMQSENCEHIAKNNKTPQESRDERIEIIKRFQTAMPADAKTLNSAVQQQWEAQWNVLEDALKKTEAMLLDMKRQIYGNSASGNQSGIPLPKSGSAGTGKTSSEVSSGRRKYTGEEKYAEAAYYLRKATNLTEVEEVCLGVNNSGTTAKRHLNQLGIDTRDNSAHKGMLSTIGIDDAIANVTDPILKHTLEEIRARGLHLKP